MRIRAPSEVSTHSSLEFSDSDIESISSQLNMAEIAKYAQPASPIPTPPAFPTELPQFKDEPDAPLMPHEVVNDEPKAGSMSTSTKCRDTLIYCENVVFDVEDTLFCVPKGGLVKQGGYFNKLFNQMASNSASSPQGSSDENPLVLHGVSKTHFQHFLGLIYSFFGVENPSTDDQWLGILHLATDWEVANIRGTALKHLEHLFKSSSSGSGPTHDPIRALALCIQYGISQHLVHQFELIITSVTPLNHDAMVDAGLDNDVVRLITDMRERWLCGKIWGMHRHPSLANHSSGLFSGRIPAKIIVQDVLKLSKLSKLSSLLVTKPDGDSKYISEEEARLDADVCLLREKEALIVEKLTREKEEAEERRRLKKEEAERRAIAAERRRLREKREREEMYQDALRVVEEEEARRAAEEEERRSLKEMEKPISAVEEAERIAREAEERIAREKAERTERYVNARKVVNAEQERRQRETQEIEKAAQEAVADRRAMEEPPVPMIATSGAAKKKVKKK